VSLVVAAVPESLPAVVTLALALGAYRMARHRAIPRRLHAVETLGSVTVIASDKTGTLTEGRMAVQRITTPDREEYVVGGVGYEPSGMLRDLDGNLVESPAPVRELARAALLCSDATIAPPTPQQPHWTPVGDPMEAALVAFAARCGLPADEVRAGWPRIAERPFDQAARRMTTVHRTPDGQYLVVCKGAPEAVLAEPVTTADPATLAALRQAAAGLAAGGLRVIAVAAASRPTRPACIRPG
jgi:P-type Ca2+ transporter type 2C